MLPLTAPFSSWLAVLPGQRGGVWYGLGFPGELVLIVFGSLAPGVRKQYREAELRKMSAAGL